MGATETHRAIEAVWKIESARVIAGLTRIVRDVGVAEELAQDALVAALEKWPESGIPENPGAWLMGTAKHRAIDFLRRGTLIDRKHEDLGRDMAEREMQVPDLAAAMDDNIGDDMLRLVFIACHPVLSTEARVALTLRLLGGLTTDEIARAYLSSEPTIAQRIVRAKRTLTEAQVPFEVPRGAEFSGGCPLFCKSSISSSMRVTRQHPETTGCGRHSAKKRCGWGGSSRTCPERTRGARTGRADGDSGLALKSPCQCVTESRCCCSIRIARGGIDC